MDTWTMIDDARKDLIGTLESLTPEQWNAPTLCEAWRVREVVAHMSAATEPLRPGTLVGLARAGFNFNKFNAVDAKRRGAASTDELLLEFRSTVGIHRKPPVVTAEDMLIDVTVHTGDIRKPLGITHAVPAERFVRAAERLKGQRFLGTPKRCAGVTLRATDADWTCGSGPEVRGPGAALLLAMSGRRAALDDLEGDGKQLLASRF